MWRPPIHAYTDLEKWRGSTAHPKWIFWWVCKYSRVPTPFCRCLVFGFWERASNVPCSAGELYYVWWRFFGILEFCLLYDGKITIFLPGNWLGFVSSFFTFCNFVWFLPGKCRLFCQFILLQICGGSLLFFPFWCTFTRVVMCPGLPNFLTECCVCHCVFTGKQSVH